ncbi:MAG: bacillithiol biosynthesis cysteine-adding enzyme BshC [Flavobacteriales bacterium]|nr:bacillithiol biosynthesis cysteine-adding enzyme BshC [Flavobacteriales bacterium]
MKLNKIPFHKTNSFTSLVLDYLDQKDQLKPFYKYFPSIENIAKAAKERSFSTEDRELLAERLLSQYQKDKVKLKTDSITLKQIESLKDKQSFTITTGHQLCLMGGPLYFIYKIAAIISLCKELNAAHTDHHFVPVFWMASEDHDFEEIDHFQYRGKKYQWNREAEGAVGRMDTNGLDEIYSQLEKDLAEFSSHANKILGLFKKAYLQSDKLSAATRVLVHELFADEGLLILDGDDVELKKSFAPYVRKELEEQLTEKHVNAQSEQLSTHYKLQVNPRKINLFYLADKARERIESTTNGYALVESERRFTKEELLRELDDHPESFSPNVLLRPLYQEVVLPNLAYIGGGGELAYWFQLISNFEAFGVDFPILILRNSALYLDQKATKLYSELGLKHEDLFKRKGDLVKDWVIDQDNEDKLLKSEKEEINKLWEALKTKSLKEDPGLEKFIAAEEQKLQNWLDRLSDKLIRAQRRNSDTSVKKIEELHAKLFPNGKLQERSESMLELMMLLGDELVPTLIESFNLPTKEFLFLETK